MMYTIPRTIRLFAFVSLLCLATVAIQAQDWAKARLEASPRHHEYVKLSHGSRTVQAFVVYPEVKDKAPAVILIHEIFGLTDWAKEMADELAAQGFIVVAPDLLSGPGANDGGSSEFPSQDAAIKAVSTQIMRNRFQRPTAQSRRLVSAGAEASPSPSPLTAKTSPPPLCFMVPRLQT